MASTMTTAWKSGATGSWFTPANWMPAVVPTAGYSAVIGSGTAIISSGSPAILGVEILLGGLATGDPVVLEADNATFGGQLTPSPEINTTIQVAGGSPFLSPLNAIFLAKGTTTYDGQITVGALGGGLTITSQSDGTNDGNFVFSNADEKAVMVVDQESVLTFAGQTITNGGLIEVLGGCDIQAGVNFTGQGYVVLEDGGNATISGNIGIGQRFDFVDETGLLTLKNLEGFSGSIGFTELAGARIDIAGYQIQSVSVDTTGHLLNLYSAPEQQGNLLGSISIASIDPESLGPAPFDLATEDFALSSDRADGTFLTYAPQNGIDLQQSLPSAIVATAGSIVSFASILENSFGTAKPGFTSITLLPTEVFHNSSVDHGYWEPSDITPQWLLNGHEITTPTVITASQISQVTLCVGNQIIHPAQFQATVTAAMTGASSERITYSAWSVDPRVVDSVQQAGFTGPPTPDSIVASATAFSQVFGQILNTNLCNWIADNVAAGAGAPMPLPNQYLDPTLNVEGGFWRIAYTGTGQDTPVSDWGTLVKPGDIVRMGWFHPESGVESGHTTTVLASVGSNGGITVYDNIDDVTVNGSKQEYIGIHGDAEYWENTDPADITIYRLDPNQQYLINGTALGEVIAGSVYNDLIRPGGGADKINAGPGDDEIQDTTAHLNGIAVTEFGIGDRFDFTDLDPTLAKLSFEGGVLTASDGTHSASLTVPGASDLVFVVTPDGNGGSFVDRLGSVTLSGVSMSGYTLAATDGRLDIAAGAVVGGRGVGTPAAHAAIVANLGTVLADGTAIGVTMNGGGTLTNGSVTNFGASISGGTGITVQGFGVVINYGVIASTIGDRALSFDSADSRLVQYASGQLIGSVAGGGGTLELARSGTPGTLSGLGSQINGFAQIVVDASAAWTLAAGSTLRTGTTLTNKGNLTLAGSLLNAGSLENEAGATLDIQGDFNIGRTGHFLNAGTLLKSAGSGVSVVQAVGNLNSSGKIVVQSGTLQLAGSLINVSAPISGAGTIAFGPGITTLSTNATVGTAGLSITGRNATLVVDEAMTYGGTFSSGLNTVLRTSGPLSTGASPIVSLTGTASFDGSTVAGFGQLYTQGETTVSGITLGQYASWHNTGALTAIGNLTFDGSDSSLYNDSTGVFTLRGKVDIVSPSEDNLFRNDGGRVIKSGGSVSTISSDLFNTGVVEVASGRLILTGDVTGEGTLQIDANQALQFDGTVGSMTVHPTVTFNGGAGLLDLSSTTLASFHGVLSGFAAGEGIDVADAASAALDGTGEILTVYDSAHASLGALSFDSSYTGDVFTVTGNTVSILSSGIDYSAATGGVYTDLATQVTEHAPAGQGWSGGPGSVTPVSTDHLDGIQTVVGSSFDDLLVGGALSGGLSGGAGNDLIYGNTSQATADNTSSLTLDGGAGNNALYGSSGFNTFLAGDANGGFNQVWGAASKMAGVSGFANNTLSFEEVAAGKSVYVDLLAGHNAYINSGPQNNGTYTLEDSIANVPNLIGSSGGDVLIADNGIDRLTGGTGADQLYAGTGHDTFAYVAYGDSNLVAGYDALYGFKSGIDKLDLSALHSDASHLLIQTVGTSNSVYLEATPGSFNANTDLAMVINTAAAGGVRTSDFVF